MGSQLFIIMACDFVPGNKSASNVSQSRRTCEIAHRQELTTEQNEASRARYRARYANMTPEQRQARCDRDKARYALRRNTPKKIEIMRTAHYANVTPEDKQAKRDHQKALKDLHRNTLSEDSIAMQNPIYVPEVVPLTVDASGPHGSTVTCHYNK
jgi:sRNA-binding carbon storage regulator CsrA